MAGVNKVIIVGRLGKDPEVRTIGNGGTVAQLTVATSENWVDKEGAKQERTEWHRVVAWGKLGEICGKHLSKGRQVYVEGRLQTRSWEDQQGVKKYSTEIVASTVQFLGSQQGERSENASSNGSSNASSSRSNSNDSGFGAQDFGPEPSFDSSEEIPF